MSNGTLTLYSNGSFSYTPNLDFNGVDTFTYRANDSIIESNIATVYITVTAVNDPPVAFDDYYITIEETTLNVSAPGVLVNDTDVENDSLVAEKISDPAHGNVTFYLIGSFSYVPDENYTGTDSFTYRAYDGNDYSVPATVYINVTPVNDPPVAYDDYYTTFEETTLNVVAPGVLLNDTDVDGDPLSAVLDVGPSYASSFTLNSDGSFDYVHDGSETTSDSFTYQAYDGIEYSNIATVTTVSYTHLTLPTTPYV